MSATKQLPEFQSEAEEARWFYERREELEEYLEPEADSGVALDAQLGLPARPRPGTLRIHIPATDLKRAQRLAARRGVSLQTFVDELLHEALDREEAQVA